MTTQQFTALGDPTRYGIFNIVAACPSSVGDIARQLPITRSAVSQHLRVLSEAGLVSHRTFGTRNVYRVNLSGVASLRDYFDAMWEKALVDFKAFAESSYNQQNKGKGKRK